MVSLGNGKGERGKFQVPIQNKTIKVANILDEKEPTLHLLQLAAHGMTTTWDLQACSTEN